MPVFEWYEQIDEPAVPLSQGDILLRTPVLERIVTDADGKKRGQTLFHNVIVITQKFALAGAPRGFSGKSIGRPTLLRA